MTIGFVLAPKETCQPLLKSIGFCVANFGVSGATAGKFRSENTTMREAYGSRSRAIVVPASDALSTLVVLTLPENGSHNSGCVCGTRKVALTTCRTLEVLATK